MMVTLDMVNQYALEHNLGSDTDIFTILSLMQLGYTSQRMAVKDIPAVSKVEWSTEDVLNLFST